METAEEGDASFDPSKQQDGHASCARPHGLGLAVQCSEAQACHGITQTDRHTTARHDAGAVPGRPRPGTFVRMREQVHSNLPGLHVEAQADNTVHRLLAYGRVVGSRITDEGEAAAQALRLLGNAVGRQASVLACIDGFSATAIAAAMCWLLAAFVPRAVPVPAAPAAGPKPH